MKRDVTYRFVNNCDDVHDDDRQDDRVDAHTSVHTSVEDEIILSNNVEQLFIDL